MDDRQAELDDIKTTGHDWDGIGELDNPPPRWWLNALYFSFILVLAYFVLYPSLPIGENANQGLLDWSQIEEYKDQSQTIEQIRAPYEAKLATLSLEQILADKEIYHYVISSAEVLFGDNCAACHGAKGYPVFQGEYPTLADKDWLYGGNFDNILMSIANGRMGQMPAHSEELSQQQVEILTQFIINLAAGHASNRGWAAYREAGCVLCHGEQAQGDILAGAPNLTDQIWRFSSHENEIKKLILHGVNDRLDPQTKQVKMPQWNQKLATTLTVMADVKASGGDIKAINWQQELSGEETERLSESDIKKLAVYVHQLNQHQQ